MRWKEYTVVKSEALGYSANTTKNNRRNASAKEFRL